MVSLLLAHSDLMDGDGGGGGLVRATIAAIPSVVAPNGTNQTLMLGEIMLFGRANETTTATTTPAPNEDIIYSNKLLQIVFCILYSSIFVLGVFGNVLVCYVVFRNKAMQTVTNLFITNLALSDILLCVLAVPFTPSYTFLGGWVFGKLLCHTLPLAQGCSVYISTLTLTSIAIDRFFVIIYPFHPRMKLSTCVTIIVLIWSFAILVTMPYGLYMRMHGDVANVTTDSSPLVAGAQSSAMYCEEQWPSEEMRKTFSIVTSILQFVLPFLIMAFCYICVSIRLNDRARTKPGSKTSRREEADRDRKKRTNRMLISMVAIFGISWLPLNLVNMCNDFHSDINGWRFYNLFFFIAHLTAMSSTCYNPFLYAWLNDNFRKEFKQVLPCFDPSRGRGGTINGTRGGIGGWRSEQRTCNGNNDTVQETLIPSSQVLPSSRSSQGHSQQQQHQQQQQQHLGTSSTTSSQGHQTTVDSILLSEVNPPLPLPAPLPSVQSAETVVLPSGVLETPFDVQLVPNAAATNGGSNGRAVDAAPAASGVVNGGLSRGSNSSKLSSLILINDGTTADSKVPAIL
ncbi:neuropeptide Y receptor type 2 [Anopheles darlingi]|uniref:Neuropeptide Y receptor type 2 n=1 Tax=Anopheles darlingi TaxID=43151 RepID=W5J9H0_ANODA|nr:neuropeptide Y receptor type 2-like [Anopheles darlingi]XP_049539160.1 neuropeptide Y receptor type 2-like [Anopheles darlingi]ETN60053.1 neuropeptide Y receptor type 2 [Anopheles darlingi]